MELEEKSLPVRIERHGNDGWWFATCDGISGLFAFGPDLEDVLERLQIAGTELLRMRGEQVLSLRVVPRADTPEPSHWGPLQNFVLEAAAA